MDGKGKDLNEESGVNRSVESSNGERAIELEPAFFRNRKIINRLMAPNENRGNDRQHFITAAMRLLMFDK